MVRPRSRTAMMLAASRAENESWLEACAGRLEGWYGSAKARGPGGPAELPGRPPVPEPLAAVSVPAPLWLCLVGFAVLPRRVGAVGGRMRCLGGTGDVNARPSPAKPQCAVSTGARLLQG